MLACGCEDECVCIFYLDSGNEIVGLRSFGGPADTYKTASDISAYRSIFDPDCRFGFALTRQRTIYLA